jgi:hypothetical protein
MQPEKAVVFGPIIIFFAILLSLIAGFLVIVVKLVLRGKKSAWKGVLVDKLHRSREDFDTSKMEHFYTLVFKIEGDKEIKVGTSKEVWDSYTIGDKAEKKSGEFRPKKIE